MTFFIPQKTRDINIGSSAKDQVCNSNSRGISQNAMLHEAIFLATCLATNVAKQVAGRISRVTPHFYNLQRQQNVALRVAIKVEISSTFRNLARHVAACDMPIATCNTIL